MNTLSPSPPSRPRLEGYLHATCQRRADSTCYLSQKRFKSPIHLSKPYWNGGSLLLNLMCPTAGMLGGDQVEIEVAVERGASLTLSNPSSLRIHKMDGNQDAHWSQNFTVKEDGFLESNPEWLILQGQSSFTQRTCLSLARGAELFFVEAIAPGRVAHGEAFCFRRFRNRLELRCDGKLAALEKHQVTPASRTDSAWNQPRGERFFYVSIYLVSAQLRPDSPLWHELHDTQSHDLRVGVSQLNVPTCWNLKILARDPADARGLTARARALFFQAANRRPADLRRS